MRSCKVWDGKRSWVLLSLLVVLSCSGRVPPPSPLDKGSDTKSSCEERLVHLSALIENLSGELGGKIPSFREASALYRLAQDLYLEGEYDLALEFLEQALRLIEESD